MPRAPLLLITCCKAFLDVPVVKYFFQHTKKKNYIGIVLIGRIAPLNSSRMAYGFRPLLNPGVL
jgi:hypothetical protein